MFKLSLGGLPPADPATMMDDELAEYRERQRRRFEEAKQVQQQMIPETYSCAQQGMLTTRPFRPSSLELATSAEPLSGYPSTPKDYCARHQRRYAAELLERQRLEDTSSIRPGATEKSNASFPAAIRDQSVDTTPRLRGSSALRAISAARALHTTDASTASPLPGAAWPGHFSSQGGGSNTSAALSPQAALPPRPGGLRRPRSRSTVAGAAAAASVAAAMSRQPALSSKEHRMELRMLNSCARELCQSNDREQLLSQSSVIVEGF
jgi:hypothetical protein